MKIRLANKIIKTWTDATDSRYFDSEYDIKESKAFNRFAALYRRATIRKNKAIDPKANVSIAEATLRNSKSCERCINFKGEFVGKCRVYNEKKESHDWCGGEAFKKKGLLK